MFGRYSCMAPATVIKIYDILSIKPLRVDGRVLVPSPHVNACDFLSFVEFFFSETLHDNLPAVWAKQLDRSMKKTASCKKATELPG